MPHFDGMYHNGGDEDDGFISIAEKLENCPHLEKYKTCGRCPLFNTCDKLFCGMSGRASMRRLKPEDISYYRERYLNLVGVAI